MPKTQNLAIDLLRIDGGTQSRVAINQDAVGEYADLIVDQNWPFPPLDVFHDGSEYFVGDGFHRVLAAQRAKRGSIPCLVHKGTAKDARIFGMTANDKHGMRMTRADKRACVEWLLDNGGKMTQKAIAEAAGVSARTVQMMVAESRKSSKPTPQSDAQIAPYPPSGGGSGEDGRTDADGTDAQETAPTPPRNGTAKRGGSPPKQLDRRAYYKQWDSAIGPLVRLVDKIAREVGDSHNGHHRDVQEHLSDATDCMMEWMEVEK